MLRSELSDPIETIPSGPVQMRMLAQRQVIIARKIDQWAITAHQQAAFGCHLIQLTK